MGGRQRDIVTEMKLLFKKLMKPAVLEHLMKNMGRLQIREFMVIETVGKRKDFQDVSLIEKRVFTQILMTHNT